MMQAEDVHQRLLEAMKRCVSAAFQLISARCTTANGSLKAAMVYLTASTWITVVIHVVSGEERGLGRLDPTGQPHGRAHAAGAGTGTAGAAREGAAQEGAAEVAGRCGGDHRCVYST